jgi:hypothetical protein
MNVLRFRHLSVVVLLLALLSVGRTADAGRPSEKDGTLVVMMTLGDVDNTPATYVYVEAHGFVRKFNSQKSFVLESSRAGRYEASLPPGAYDVFVSEGTSEPRCRRMLVRAGSTSTWTLKLEVDEVYTDQ